MNESLHVCFRPGFCVWAPPRQSTLLHHVADIYSSASHFRPPHHTHTHITTNLRLSLSASFHSFLSVLVFVYRLYVCVVFLHVDMCVCTLSLAPPSLSACMGNSLLSTSMHTHTHRETTFTSETCTVIPVVSTSSKVTSSDMTFPPANGWYWSQFPVSEVFSWPKKKVWGQKKQLCWGLFTLTHV